MRRLKAEGIDAARPAYIFCTNGLRFLRTRWFLRLQFQ